MIGAAAVLVGAMPAPLVGADLEALLLRNEAAVGGAENWRNIRNVRYELTIEEPNFEVDAVYVGTRDGKMRIDIQMDGEKVFSEWLDGDGQAWQWTPSDGVSEQAAQSSAALRHGIEFPGRFFTLMDLYRDGTRVTQEGQLLEDDRLQWRVRVTLADEFSRDYFIDEETALVVREHDRRAFHPAADPTAVLIETRRLEPDWLNGTLMYRSSRNINLETGEWLATTRIRNAEHNVELPPDYFSGR